MKKIIVIAALSLIIVTICQLSTGQGIEITKKNITFIEYPGFPEAHSTWGSIGYDARYNIVLIGVTNHHDKIGLYSYNPILNKMDLKGFIDNMGYLRSFQWQGKIHSKITFDSTGLHILLPMEVNPGKNT